MKRSTFCLALALPFLTALGCAVEGNDALSPAPTGQTAQQLSGFNFDSTALAETPPRTLPTGLLPVEAFSNEMIVRSLIQTTEPFAEGARLGATTEMVSPNWKFEKDTTQGAILVLKTTPSGAGEKQDEAVLQRRALSRIGSFGIGGVEIGRTLQRRSMQQPQDDTLGAPELHRYKTFVFRAINRIPVEGHRVVISHAPDGSFVRAFMKWPAIASSGHRLTTTLLAREIEERAVRALTAEGETKGNVRLSYKYVPTQLPSGEVALSLKVSARMDAAGDAEEAREIDVDVDAR